MKKTSDVEWDEIARELRRLSRILAVMAIRDIGTLRDKVNVLEEMGFLPAEIARITGTTPNTVSVMLHVIRRQSRQKTKRGKKAITQ